MLEIERIRESAVDVARASLGPPGVKSVVVEPTVNVDGEDALRVMIVIPADTVHDVREDALIRLLVDLREKLESEGERREPIVEYATPEELAADVDPES
jgi:diphthamide biosynthesis methyltransferase